MTNENTQQNTSYELRTAKTMMNVSLVGYLMGIGVLFFDLSKVLTKA